MRRELNNYINKFLSPFLCGYKQGYSTQIALMTLIEKWKICLDQKGYRGALLMDLSKGFDTVNHKLLIAKLHVCGFSKDSLEIIRVNYYKGQYNI